MSHKEVVKVMVFIKDRGELYFSEILDNFADLDRRKLEDIVSSLVKNKFCKVESTIFEDEKENKKRRARIQYIGDVMR